MTAADITEALDTLDWLTDEEIQPLRACVRRMALIARERKAAGAPRNPSPIDASFSAMVWVLWTTSDDYLQMQLEK